MHTQLVKLWFREKHARMPLELDDLDDGALWNVVRHVTQLRAARATALTSKRWLALCKLEWLEHLYLEKNLLDSVPKQIQQLKRLHTLDLDGNNFTAIPEPITFIRGLQRLSLSENKITTVPPEIRRLRNLIELNLDNNMIGPALPENMWRLCGSLRILGLENNHLDSEKFFANHVIQRLTGLTILRIGGNRGSQFTVVHPLSGLAMPGVTVPKRMVDGFWQTREGIYKVENGTPVYKEVDLEGYIHASVDYNVDNGRWYKEFNTEIYDMICNRARQRKLGLGL